jgi:hypothetical protein
LDINVLTREPDTVNTVVGKDGSSALLSEMAAMRNFSFLGGFL